MDGSHLRILYIPVQSKCTYRFKLQTALNFYAELVEWINGRGPAPLQELASWPSPLLTTPPRVDKVAAPSTWDNPTNQTDPSSPPNRHLLPPTAADASDASQATSATQPIPPHPSHTPPFEISHSNTDFAIRLLKPRPTQGCVVVLPRIETHVYLNIDLPLRSWNAIQLPLTTSVRGDNSSSVCEGIKPLLLVITARGATTQQEYNRVCEKCEKRLGNKTGSPGLIDFHSSSNILTPNGGMVQVHFAFSCYSRHHRKEDEQYVYVAMAW